MKPADLPSIEALIYPREHTFSALKRTIAQPGSTLAEFYRAIHSRPAPVQAKPFLDIPLVDHTSALHRRSLVTADPDLPLSVVITTRNDTHVERMEERTQAFIDGIYHQAERIGRRVELIIVEWNPPADRVSMAAQYRFPDSHPLVSAAIVTVDNELHRKYQYAASLPLYQMIAKNAGIRRARGQYVLVTNVDILLGDSMFDLITSPSRLRAGALYRANRWDVDRKILDEPDIGKMIKASAENCIRRNTRQGATETSWICCDWNEETNLFELANYTWFPDLHTEGCGDFQMMDRESWLRLGGYCEVDAFSMHIDSLFALTCHHAGIEEVDMADEHLHFHIDHSLGDEVKPSVYLTRDKTELKHPSMMTLYNLHASMSALGSAYAFNEDGWGFAATDLPMTWLTRAEWESDQSPVAILTAKEGCRLSLRQLLEGPGIMDFDEMQTWLDESWTVTADYITKARGDRALALWGMGGRARYAIHQLAGRYTSFDAIVDDGLMPLFAGADSFSVMNAGDLPADFFRRYFVVVAAIFAENIRPKLEANGAVEGRDYIVTT